MKHQYCPFCTLEACEIIAETELTVTIRDNFPVSPGHTLIIPRRHIHSLFHLTEMEQMAILQALSDARFRLSEMFAPDGYNIGINDGAAAGQTVMHLHIHLIPRYRGDCADPRGGIRHLFPEKAVYWEEKPLNL
ncbi:HIT family protein [Thioflexithrix psekupsensis]|uniref:HIT family protein n=2 Tax=Thioflexithrix psekupsensis TaxID=1570016 RepID=A0A251XA46_9GAMM|nr:HIT family protein [Thioflexithrix psekupsensis]